MATSRRNFHWHQALLCLSFLPSLPAGASAAELRLGFLYIQGPSSWQQESFSQFKLAVRDVNAEASLLPNHTLTYQLADTEGDELRALQGAVQLLSGAAPAHAIVGTGYSGALSAPAVYCSMVRVPIVSPGSTSVLLTDKQRFPYLIRSLSNDAGYLKCAAVLTHTLGWRKVASLTSAVFEQGAIEVLHPSLKALGVEYLALAHDDITTVRGEQDLNNSLSLIARAGFRVIIYFGRTNDMSRLDAISRASGLRTEDYSWVLLEVGFFGAWRSATHVFAVLMSGAGAANPAREAFEARWPTVSTVYNETAHGSWDPTTKMPFYGANAHSDVIWDTDYAPIGDGKPDTYGMVVYDTVWVLARAFHNLLLGGGDPSDGPALRAEILAVQHAGVSGNLVFDQGTQDRIEPLEIVMTNGTGPRVLVGRTTGLFATGVPGDGSWCLSGGCLDVTQAEISALPWRGGRPVPDGRALDAAKSDGSVGDSLVEGARISVRFTARDSFGRPPCVDTCSAVGNSTVCQACHRDLAAYDQLQLEAYDLSGRPVPPLQPAVLSVDVLTGRGAIELPLGFSGGSLEDRELDLLLRHRGRTVPLSAQGGKRIALITPACSPGMSGEPGQCVRCIPGRMAPRRGMSNCTACGRGTAQELVGQASCKSCSRGHAAGAEGMSACSACPFGTHLNATGGSACDPCPPPMTTLLPGAESVLACVCPLGMYRPLGTHVTEGQARGPCRACPPGTDCPAGSDERNLPGGSGGAASPAAPQVLPGYWSSSTEPLYVFKCQGGPEQCPGGAPESCSGQALGITCAVCPAGYFREGAACSECPSPFMSNVIFPILPTIILLVGIIAFYKIVDHQDDVAWNLGHKSILNLLALSLYEVQVVSILVTCNVDIPQGDARAWGWATDILSLFHISCGGVTAYSTQLVVKLLAPAGCCLGFLAVGLLSMGLGKFRRRWRMDPNVLWGCMGTAFMGFYVTVAAISFSLFKCFEHPNGELSVHSAPSVLCFREEWMQLVIMASLAVAIYCGGSAALIIWVLWRMPAHRGKDAFNKRWGFVVAKFRPSCRWWSLPWLAKGLALNLAQVASTRGQDQVLLLQAIIVAYFVACSRYSPWRHPDVNSLDSQVHSALVLFCSLLYWYAPPDGHDGGRATWMHVLALAPLAACLRFLAARVVQRAAPSRCGAWLEEHITDRVVGKEIRKSKLQRSFLTLAELDSDRLNLLLAFMPETDLRMLQEVSAMLEEVEVLRDQLVRRSSRLSGSSSEASLPSTQREAFEAQPQEEGSASSMEGAVSDPGTAEEAEPDDAQRDSMFTI